MAETTASSVDLIENLDGTSTECFGIDPTEERLLALLRELFEDAWNDIVFGPCLQGAVFELRFSDRPKVDYLDGYLTIGPKDPHSWHFHLCVGPTTGTKTLPTPPELAQWRRCARAAFFRDRDARGRPNSWGFRMWNGRGEQMLTVFFPNPWLDPERRRFVSHPDWTRLDLWMRLRERYAGIPVEPLPSDATPPITH